MALDFRKLNEITLPQDFVIPTLDDILHEISGSNYFSALDMKSAFNQIPLHFADRHKTAFSTPDGACSPNNKCLCVKRVWPMRRRVNLTSVLRSGITGHAPMTGFTVSAVCYPTADSMIPARS
ncbi:hypothetical protein TNCV_2163971 [Trichonephila clavipes]|nr:hypothetical protein TNCV_2163971 [Trichonephila clavipes]